MPQKPTRNPRPILGLLGPCLPLLGFPNNGFPLEVFPPNPETQEKKKVKGRYPSSEVHGSELYWSELWTPVRGSSTSKADEIVVIEDEWCMDTGQREQGGQWGKVWPWGTKVTVPRTQLCL